MESFRVPLVILGSMLIVAGSVLLLYVASLVYTVFNSPGDLPIVKYIIENVRAGDLALFGTFANPDDPAQKAQFDLHWSEPVRMMCFIFIGAVSVGILARILAVLISSGTSILKLAFAVDAMKNKTGNP